MQTPSKQAIEQEVIQDALKTCMGALGHDGVFQRVIAEVHRVNASMPDATGEQKKQKVIADAKIIFTDLVVPVAGQFLNYLIEAAVLYIGSSLAAQAK